MATLTATIDASQRTIALSGDVSAAVPGRLYAIEDEIVLLEGFGDLTVAVQNTEGSPSQGAAQLYALVQYPA